eukprot:4333695-Amphidinium_carterae.1
MADLGGMVELEPDTTLLNLSPNCTPNGSCASKPFCLALWGHSKCSDSELVHPRYLGSSSCNRPLLQQFQHTLP